MIALVTVVLAATLLAILVVVTLAYEIAELRRDVADCEARLMAELDEHSARLHLLERLGVEQADVTRERQPALMRIPTRSMIRRRQP